jgi:hypothetical protein
MRPSSSIMCIVRFVPCELRTASVTGSIYESVGSADEAVVIAKRLAEERAYGAGIYSAEVGSSDTDGQRATLWEAVVH